MGGSIFRSVVPQQTQGAESFTIDVKTSHCNQLSLSFSKQVLGVSNFQCCCPLKGNVNGRLFLKVSFKAIHMSNSDMADCKSFARQQNPENIDPSLLYVAYEPCDIAHKSAQFGRHRSSRTNTAAKKGVQVDQKTSSLFRQNS